MAGVFIHLEAQAQVIELTIVAQLLCTYVLKTLGSIKSSVTQNETIKNINKLIMFTQLCLLFTLLLLNHAKLSDSRRTVDPAALDSRRQPGDRMFVKDK